MNFNTNFCSFIIILLIILTTMRQKKSKMILEEMKELIAVIHSRINKSVLSKGKKNIPLIPQPKALMGGTLKQYQLETLAWLVELSRHHLNAILADDMGLGKTIQGISFLCHQFEETGAKGPHLIVVPKNVLRNWERQIISWAKDFKAVILPGTELERQQCLRKYVRPKNFDILIATFQSVQSASDSLRKIKWKTMIVDEAHSIKNDDTQLAICLRRFSPAFKLLMTGTPLSNQLRQLWSLLNFILPDIFTDDSLFERIEESANTDYEDEEQKIKFQAEVAQKFKLMINPFLMRRCKSEINLGLKEKKQITLFTSLCPLQLTMYRNFLKTKSVYGDQSNPQYSAHVQLAKVCLHPYIFPNIEAPDAPPLGEHLVQNSGKLKLLDKLLNKLIKQNHKILIFSQFTTMLKILQDYCSYRKYDYCLIDGSTSLDERDQGVERFSKEKNCRIFLISTRAGGIGLNLVAADVVVLYDLDWNPQMDKQAMDRAYRIGQKNKVLVFRLITNNTIEERKLEVQKYKLLWDELVIQKGGLARIKNSEQKFQKINMDKIAYSGAEQIFKLQTNYDDQAIEDIIRMGQDKDKKKTAEIRKKLQKQFQKFQTTDPYEQIYGNNEKVLNQIKQYQQKIIKANSKKEELGRRRNPKEKNESFVSIPIKPRRKILPFKFYTDLDRVDELLDAIEESDQTLKIKYEDQLREIGFYDWTKSDYSQLVQALIQYGSSDIKKITQSLHQKSEKEVKKYLQVFFEKAQDDKFFTTDLNRIKKADKKREEDEKMANLESQYMQIPEDVINFQPKIGGIRKINTESCKWLVNNELRQIGVGYEENKQILADILPFYASRIQRTLEQNNRKKIFFQQIVGEDKSPQKIREKMQERYQQIQKKILSLTNSSQKLGVVGDDDSAGSAKTEIKK